MAQDKPKRRFALTPTKTNSPAAVRGFGGNSYGFAVTERRFFGSVIDDVVASGGGVTGSLATSQAQSTSAGGLVAFPPVSGSLGTSQAQSSSSSGTYTPPIVSGTSSSRQAQTAGGAGFISPPIITGTLAASQAQTSALVGTLTVSAISGSGASSQAQSTTAAGATALPLSTQARRAGGARRFVVEKELPQEEQFDKELRAPYSAPTKLDNLVEGVESSLSCLPISEHTTLAIAAIKALSKPSKKNLQISFPAPLIGILPETEEIPDEVFLLAFF